jgi:hypothetical protein
MRFERFSFGSITIDGKTYHHDVVIERGKIRKRDKLPSKRLKSNFGHTPLSASEAIPWSCRRLLIGTGFYGQLPVTDDLVREANRRGVELVTKPTEQIIKDLDQESDTANAILHVTC